MSTARQRWAAVTALILSACAVPVRGENGSLRPDHTPIGGPLPSLLTAQPYPYLVSAPLFVPPGETVEIEPGVVVLFSGFTGLVVHGTLRAQGTPQNPIVFTSVHDTLYAPPGGAAAAPYDWNGIDISENSVGTTLSNCRIAYSTYGVRSATEQVRLAAAHFEHNGNAAFSVHGESIFDADGFFSFGEAPAQKELLSDRAMPGKLRNRNNPFLSYLALVVAVGSTAVGVWQTTDFVDQQRRLSEISQPTPQNRMIYSSKDWASAREKRNVAAAGMGIAYAAAVVGAVGFFWTYTF